MRMRRREDRDPTSSQAFSSTPTQRKMTSVIQGRLSEEIHAINKLEQLTSSLFECVKSGTSTRAQWPEEKLKPGAVKPFTPW